MKTLKTAVVSIALTALAATAWAQTKIKVGYTGSTDYVAAFVAKEEGFFQKRGLDVELQLMTNNALGPAALQSNSLQVATPTPPVLLQARDAGIDIVYVAGGSVITKQTTTVGLVARPGLDIKNAKDFEGKKVAIPGLGAILHITFQKWLMDRGADLKKVTMIEFAMPQIADAVKGGTVDAAVVTDPFLTRITTTGIGNLVSYYMSETFPPGTMGVGYATTSAWAAANPAALKAFREAIAEGAALATKDSALARAAIGKYIKVPPEILSTMQIATLDPIVTEKQVNDWSTILVQQGMLKAGEPASKIVAK
ncbi:MAG TPA: ABC transporter substrate-binding protein [Rubrivivax sp.]|nr:ABC transporter substrate-binding protein [Rubrivivax sp.]